MRRIILLVRILTGRVRCSESSYRAYIDKQLAKGARIETQTPTMTVLLKGEKVNHVLHLLLSVFTAGIWLPFWIVVAATGGVRRKVVRLELRGEQPAKRPVKVY
ncbi:MAG: hypothetical protein F4Y97_05530 [Dehalococcoidia bacterium]|nr:hypothetical protein [Dehalococcoidia bacterium]